MVDFIFVIIRPPDIVCWRTYILPVFLLLLSFFLSFFFSSFFRQLISEVAERNSTKIGHMLWSKCNLKTHVRNRWQPQGVSYIVPKCHELWSTNGSKPDQRFYPLSLFLFCCSPLHTLYAALTWRPTATVDEMALGSFAAKIWSPKDVKLEMLSGRAALSGNTSL